MKFNSLFKGKKSWPELFGTQAQGATIIIESQNENVDAIIVEEGSSMSIDIRCDRVRVFADKNDVVKEVPKVVKGKKSWPELVGTQGEAATTIIERQNGNVDAVIVEEGSSVSDDIRCDRVRVFVDDNGIVKKAPKVERERSVERDRERRSKKERERFRETDSKRQPEARQCRSSLPMTC
ncbi:hypothetical protein OSB04_011550 [Centaurea solstitialis]|uniref:Uncharacterized protein n=1 Tax=Centaurea solstitialis TaxID=347529 RepID=A0AA38TMS6_9ASTR|nr:hypothetical protein OSB04_011550 [Centaurea solstitialis]